jgi:hypothetical protein
LKAPGLKTGWCRGQGPGLDGVESGPATGVKMLLVVVTQKHVDFIGLVGCLPVLWSLKMICTQQPSYTPISFHKAFPLVVNHRVEEI